MESTRTTYLKFILLMWTMYLKIDFYWWEELVLIFKFKDTAAGAHALLWGPKGIRCVQQCLSHSSCHEVWTFRLWLQKLVYLVNDFSPLVRKILEISFFFKSLSLSLWNCCLCVWTALVAADASCLSTAQL